MSLFSKIGHAIAAPVKGIEHLVTDPGKAISNIGKSVAPVYHGVATGAGALGGLVLGGPAGAIAGAKVGDKLGNIGDDALAGRSVAANLGDNLLGAGESAALGGLASGALGSLGGIAKNIPGVSSVASILGAGGGAGAGAIPDAAFGDTGGGWLSTLGGLAKDAAGGIGGLLTGNNGLNALGVAQGVSSILDQKKATDYANKAVGTVENAYNEKAPLRAQSLDQLLHPQAPDLSNLQGIAGSLPASTVASRPVSQFTAPERKPSAVSLQQLLQNNPYAGRAA